MTIVPLGPTIFFVTACAGSGWVDRHAAGRNHVEPVRSGVNLKFGGGELRAPLPRLLTFWKLDCVAFPVSGSGTL
uniref:Secreted protein n=1 Tax=Knipowitschia caucasica TaxID=637954 RepID=A0AAV2JUY9_KNICA